MSILSDIESAVFNKTALPEFDDISLWQEIRKGDASPTQCNLAIWFSLSPNNVASILEILQRKYPDYYLQSILPHALAKAIVEDWCLLAYNIILKLSALQIPFYGVIEALIKMPRESFIGRFDPRARMLPRPRR